MKHSENYAEFCEIMNEALNKPDDEPLDERFEKILAARWKDKGKPYVGTNYDDPWRFQFIWNKFGDVRRTQFTDWWEKNKGTISYGAVPPVIDLSNPDLDNLPDFFVAAHRRWMKNDRNKFPTIEEFLNILTVDKEYFYVAIPIEGTIKAKMVELSRIRKNKLEDYKRWKEDSYYNFPKLTGKVYIEELERYLDIYSLFRETGDIKDIIKSRHGELFQDDDTLKSAYTDDLRRAKKIMENVEDGIFPGNYQPR